MKFIKLLALGWVFGRLSWNQIETLRQRHWNARQDANGRLSFLGHRLRDRVWYRLVGLPAFLVLALCLAGESLNDESLWAKPWLLLVAALAASASAAATAAALRSLPALDRSRGLPGESSDDYCDRFERTLGRLQQIEPELFERLCDRGDASDLHRAALGNNSDIRSPLFDFAAWELPPPRCRTSANARSVTQTA